MTMAGVFQLFSSQIINKEMSAVPSSQEYYPQAAIVLGQDQDLHAQDTLRGQDDIPRAVIPHQQGHYLVHGPLKPAFETDPTAIPVVPAKPQLLPPPPHFGANLAVSFPPPVGSVLTSEVDFSQLKNLFQITRITEIGEQVPVLNPPLSANALG